jgi:HSP20 family protein
MNLQPWPSFRVQSKFQRQIDELFREVIQQPWENAETGSAWQPAIDIYETEEAYLIEADLPGVESADVQVRVDGPLLTICGTRKSSQESQHLHGIYCERASGRFCRTVLLQHPVDQARMTMECKQGIYHIRLPKQLLRA